jgi:hypothetical protein
VGKSEESKQGGDSVSDPKASNRILAILKQLRTEEPQILEEEEADAADAAAVAEEEARKAKKKKPGAVAPADDELTPAVPPVPVAGTY